ncbi:histone-lysine N-methyltransferase SETMAR [Trichonephila clavipes]|nr:histone-lysine N-methyltransferase SETMAR [Trichonephila clavipes]
MESDKQHFRHILLFYYRKGKNAVQARKKLTDVYGEGVLTLHQCQNWFAKFRSGNFDVEMHHVREGQLKLIKTR